MNSQRLFLAIKLPKTLQERLINYQTKFLVYPIFRLVPSDNLHLTFIFLGDVKSDKISFIEKIIQEVKQMFTESVITIHLQDITYGPHQKSPRLVWAKGTASSSLFHLRQQIVSRLLSQGIYVSDASNEWLPHVTIARVRNHSLFSLPPASTIEQKLVFDFSVFDIWLMESFLSPRGSYYKDQEKFTIYEK